MPLDPTALRRVVWPALVERALAQPDPLTSARRVVYALLHPPRTDTGFGAHVVGAGEAYIASTVLTPLGASALNYVAYGRTSVPLGALMSYNWEFGTPDMGDTAGSTDVIGSSDVGGPDTVLDTGQWGALPSLFPSINLGGGSSIPALVGGTQASGGMMPVAGVMPAVGAAIRAMSPVVVGAIIKLSRTLGGAGGSVVGYGTKIWRQLSTWAAANPGVSLVSMLVSLGLTVEEAAHFIAWGTTRKRKRRARGISGRELKTTRRTIRKLQYFNHLLSGICPPRRHYARRAVRRR